MGKKGGAGDRIACDSYTVYPLYHEKESDWGVGEREGERGEKKKKKGGGIGVYEGPFCVQSPFFSEEQGKRRERKRKEGSSCHFQIVHFYYNWGGKRETKGGGKKGKKGKRGGEERIRISTPLLSAIKGSRKKREKGGGKGREEEEGKG